MAPPLFTGLKFEFLSNGSVNNQATIDPYFANRKLLLHMDGSNNSTTFTDSSSSVRTITPLNQSFVDSSSTALSVLSYRAAISTLQSKFGGASGYFDGTAMIKQDSVPALVFGTGDFTVEFWIYPTVFSTYNVWWDSRTYYGFNGFALATNSSGQIFFFADRTTYITTSATVSLNQWTHIAATRTGTTIYLFINGIQAGTNTCASSFDSGNLLFGKTNENDSNFFRGYADELRASNRCEYTSNFTPPSAPFPNSVLDGDVNFSSRKLLLHMNSTGNPSISTTQSKYGGASGYLDGISWFDISPILSFTGEYTLECWIRPSDLSDRTIFSNLGNSGEALLRLEQNGAVGFTLGINQQGIVTTNILLLNTWAHIAVTRNASNLVTLWINGVSRGTNTLSGTHNISCIGARKHPYVNLLQGFFLGWIDELRISDRAEYTSNFTPSTGPFPNS